jgi:hypothetical protein
MGVEMATRTNQQKCRNFLTVVDTYKKLHHPELDSASLTSCKQAIRSTELTQYHAYLANPHEAARS